MNKRKTFQEFPGNWIEKRKQKEILMSLVEKRNVENFLTASKLKIVFLRNTQELLNKQIDISYT